MGTEVDGDHNQEYYYIIGRFKAKLVEQMRAADPDGKLPWILELQNFNGKSFAHGLA
jgi:hypothetical protein